MTYKPLSGENYDRQAAQSAWFESMARTRHERNGPYRWVLHGQPGAWRWVFFNFGPWTGTVTVEADGFHWATRSYDTGQVLLSGVTTSVFEVFQSVEQNKMIKREGTQT